MPKAKKVDFPETVYVQRVTDDDDSYLMAYEDVEDIDLDYGSVVGVYTLGIKANVSTAPRIVEEV